jgi:hypothetical protein
MIGRTGCEEEDGELRTEVYVVESKEEPNVDTEIRLEAFRSFIEYGGGRTHRGIEL